MKFCRSSSPASVLRPSHAQAGAPRPHTSEPRAHGAPRRPLPAPHLRGCGAPRSSLPAPLSLAAARSDAAAARGGAVGAVPGRFRSGGGGMVREAPDPGPARHRARSQGGQSAALPAAPNRDAATLRAPPSAPGILRSHRRRLQAAARTGGSAGGGAGRAGYFFLFLDNKLEYVSALFRQEKSN